MQVERLEIPITGSFGEVKLCVYPASGNAKLFEEDDAVDYGFIFAVGVGVGVVANQL